MRRFFGAIVLVFALALHGIAAAQVGQIPAWPPVQPNGIGTPTLILENLSSFSSGTALSTSANSPANNAIFVFLTNQAAQATITDSAGNSYSTALFQSALGITQQISYCLNCLALPSGGTITATWTGAGTGAAAVVISVSGVNGGLDQTNSASGATGTSGSVATSTLAASNELILGGNAIFTLYGTFTPAPGFTEIYSTLQEWAADYAYEIVSTNSAVTYNPTWTTSQAWGSIIAAFKKG